MKRLVVTVLLSALALPAFGASCKISEYSSLATDDGGRPIPVAREPGLAKQSVTYTTSAASSAFNANTRFVRIVCDAKAHFVFGTAPTSVATDPYLAADAPEYFAVPRGQSYKVSFYDGTS